MPLTTDQTAIVRQELADCLAVEPDEITPVANFFHDLGGESIDVLDLQFRIERATGIRPDFQIVKPSDDSGLDSQGRFSPEALQHYRAQFPDLPFPAGEVTSPKDLFTVAMIEALVARAIRSAPVNTAPNASSPAT
jgi:acyl carrier protein